VVHRVRPQPLSEAARQAAAVAAHREAVGHYRAVLPLAGRLPAAVRAELLEAYSVECYLAGLSAEAVSARRAAVELWEAAGDRERVGEGLRWLSRLHWWDGSRREAEAAAARAIACWRPCRQVTSWRWPGAGRAGDGHPDPPGGGGWWRVGGA
jgi:hypothetical protein